MISFDQALAELVRAKLVTYEVAVAHSTTPDDFALTFRGVSSGGSGDDSWQQDMVNKQNLGPPARGAPAKPGAGPAQGQTANAGEGDFKIDRFGKE
jgi:hypothetical protein